MDYLWTPWRYTYVSNADKIDGCVFCERVAWNDDRKARIVHRGEHCFIILNAFPYTSGHVMVVPYEHVDELQKLSRAAAEEMMLLTQRMETVFRKLYHPDGVNLGMNIGKAAGAGIRGTYPHARAAALGGRRELHERGGRNQSSSGRSGDDVGADTRGVRVIGKPKNRKSKICWS